MKKFLATLLTLLLFFSLAAFTACSAKVTAEYTYERMLTDTSSYTEQYFKIRLRIKADTKNQTVLEVTHVKIPDEKGNDTTCIAQNPGSYMEEGNNLESFLKQLEGMRLESFKDLPGIVYFTRTPGLPDTPEYIYRFSHAMAATEDFAFLIGKAFVIDAVSYTLKQARLI